MNRYPRWMLSKDGLKAMPTQLKWIEDGTFWDQMRVKHAPKISVKRAAASDDESDSEATPRKPVLRKPRAR